MLTNEAIVLADGQFPTHNVPVELLNSGLSIVCCDGATAKLNAYGLCPDAIVGDLDSLPNEFKTMYADRLHHFPDQETNDLTKAVHFCLSQGATHLHILGATGIREDHTLGNISLLAQYACLCRVYLYTDTGYFTAVQESCSLKSYKGQQVSIFSLTPQTLLTVSGLKYPIEQRKLQSWWEGTLNEALSEQFTMQFDQGVFLVFRLY